MRAKFPSLFDDEPQPRSYGPGFIVVPAQEPVAPVLFASPHSGTEYPASMTKRLRVPLMDVRRTEDTFIDRLFSDAPALGAALIKARYGRGFIDLNRDSRELDPSMFAGRPPRACGPPTARVEAGLGCIPRICVHGEDIYDGPLDRTEGERRLIDVHDAYHARVSEMLNGLRDAYGEAVLIDCHSMPSTQPGRRNLPDIVLGDRYGSSCDGRITGLAERTFRSLGYSVARNAPYAGGYTTRRYGRPRRGLHALQIEINRTLYMDERSLTLHTGFRTLKADVSAVCRALLDFSARAMAA